MSALKKTLATATAFAMAATMVACSGNGGNTSTQASKEGGSDTGSTASSQKRVINVGTWWEIYYTSDHDDIYDNPAVTNTETAQMQLDNMRAIEEKYNIELHFVNLTWDGIMESINTSIMAGTPDCDIYMVDLQFGVPAVLNGWAQPISSFAAEDSDIYTDQVVMKYLNVLDMEEDYLFAGNSINTSAYVLGFNMDAINSNGLENPQDLYDAGEWTWDKFYEYCKTLTQDTDGDGKIDQYGYTGWWTTFFSQMNLANGASVASTETEGLSSPETLETLEFISKLYSDGYARPWDPDDWNINVSAAADGEAVFWTTAAWVEQSYFIDSETGETPFEIGIVPFPIGPSGDQETNATRSETDNWQFIPVGIEDPTTVYNVYYDWCNWYNFDTTYRDDTEWSENMMYSGGDDDLSARNFEYLKAMGTNSQLELWDKLGVDLGIYGLVVVDGTTPAQIQEEHASEIQAALDAYMGK